MRQIKGSRPQTRTPPGPGAALIFVADETSERRDYTAGAAPPQSPWPILDRHYFRDGADAVAACAGCVPIDLDVLITAGMATIGDEEFDRLTPNLRDLARAWVPAHWQAAQEQPVPSHHDRAGGAA